MNLTLKTSPTVEPVSLAEAKLFCRVDGSEDDGYISTLITAARNLVEQGCGRALITQTWYLRLDEFPCEIIVPNPPLSSVTAITYVDTGGNTQTVSSSAYTVDTYSQPGRIFPAFAQVFPPTRGIPNAVTVEFVCGYGATYASVPPGLRQAILYLVNHWYGTREPVNQGVLSPTPLAVQSLIAQYDHGWRW